MKVTRLELRLLGACRAQRQLFEETFGKSAEINAENMAKAMDAGLWVHFYFNCLRRATSWPTSNKKTKLLRDLYKADAARRIKPWEYK